MAIRTVEQDIETDEAVKPKTKWRKYSAADKKAWAEKNFSPEQRADWSKKKRETEKERIEMAQNHLEEGFSNMLEEKGWRDYLEVQARLHRYSASNAVLIHMQTPTHEVVMGQREWNRNGYTVIPEEKDKSIIILAPRIKKFEVKNTNQELEDDDDGDGDGDEATKRYRVIQGFIPVEVFDISQMQAGPKAKEVRIPVKSELKGDISMDNYTRLKEYMEGLGWDVIEGVDVANPQAAGSCSLNEKLIHVRSDLSTLQRTKTLIHEGAHAALHTHIEDRGKIVPSQSAIERKSRGEMEVEAESVAFMVCKSLGLSTDEYSFGYIGGWITQKGNVELEKRCSELSAKGRPVTGKAKEELRRKLMLGTVRDLARTVQETAKGILKVMDVPLHEIENSEVELEVTV